MNIILFEDGSWEHEEHVSVFDSIRGRDYLLLTIGENWSDREIGQMINDYYKENLHSIFQ